MHPLTVKNKVTFVVILMTADAQLGVETQKAFVTTPTNIDIQITQIGLLIFLFFILIFAFQRGWWQTWKDWEVSVIRVHEVKCPED